MAELIAIEIDAVELLNLCSPPVSHSSVGYASVPAIIAALKSTPDSVLDAILAPFAHDKGKALVEIRQWQARTEKADRDAFEAREERDSALSRSTELQSQRDAIATELRSVAAALGLSTDDTIESLAARCRTAVALGSIGKLRRRAEAADADVRDLCRVIASLVDWISAGAIAHRETWEQACLRSGRYREDILAARDSAVDLEEKRDKKMTELLVRAEKAEAKLRESASPTWLADAAEALGEVRPCDGSPLALNWSQVIAAIGDMRAEGDEWKERADKAEHQRDWYMRDSGVAHITMDIAGVSARDVDGVPLSTETRVGKLILERDAAIRDRDDAQSARDVATSELALAREIIRNLEEEINREVAKSERLRGELENEKRISSGNKSTGERFIADYQRSTARVADLIADRDAANARAEKAEEDAASWRRVSERLQQELNEAKAAKAPASLPETELAPGSRWEGDAVVTKAGASVRMTPDREALVIRAVATQGACAYTANVIAVLRRAGLLPDAGVPREKVEDMLRLAIRGGWYSGHYAGQIDLDDAVKNILADYDREKGDK